jgi:AraC-like DNA-binding protein
VEQRTLASNFSEILLLDLRVEASTNLLVEIRENGGAKYPATNRPLIHFVLSGKAVFRLASSNTSTELYAGDSVLVLYGDPHVIAATQGCVPSEISIAAQSELVDEIPTIRVGIKDQRARLLTCALELAYLSPSASANRAAADFCIIRNGGPSGIDGGLTFLPEELERCCQGTGATAFATMLASFQFVNFCRRSVKELWSVTRPRNRDPNARRISAALRKIHTYPNRLWTVANLAEEVGLSRSSFAEEFVNCVGTTPHAYLTELRMKRAAHLLEEGSISCREIASRVGYPIESSFCRAFKRYFGVAPTAYVEAASDTRSAPHLAPRHSDA